MDAAGLFQPPKSRENHSNGCTNSATSFLTFSPTGWSIELELIEEVINDLLDVLCSILDDPWPVQTYAGGRQDRPTLKNTRNSFYPPADQMTVSQPLDNLP